MNNNFIIPFNFYNYLTSSFPPSTVFFQKCTAPLNSTFKPESVSASGVSRVFLWIQITRKFTIKPKKKHWNLVERNPIKSLDNSVSVIVIRDHKMIFDRSWSNLTPSSSIKLTTEYRSNRMCVWSVEHLCVGWEWEGRGELRTITRVIIFRGKYSFTIDFPGFLRV